jgi:hypothetical protein
VRRSEPFCIQQPRDLLIHFLSRRQFLETLLKGFQMSALSIRAHPARQPVFGGRTRLPVDLKPNFAALTLLIEEDLFDDQAQEALPVGRGGGGCPPDFGQVFAEGQNVAPIGRGQVQMLLLLPGLVGLFELFDVPELLFPLAFERPGHQTVFRFHRLILAACPGGLIPSALEPQLPLLAECSRFLFQFLQSGQGQGDLVRHQGLEDQAFNFGIHVQRADFLATRTAILLAGKSADIDRERALRPGVMQAQMEATPTTDGGPLQ